MLTVNKTIFNENPEYLYNDLWNFNEDFLHQHKEKYGKWGRQSSIDFSIIKNASIKENLKLFAYISLKDKALTLRTLSDYFVSSRLKTFNSFLHQKNYIYIDFQELLSKPFIDDEYKLFLKKEKIKNNPYNMIFFNQIPKLLNLKEYNFNDIWDVRDIDESKISKHRSDFKLNFSNILEEELRNLAKKFIKYRLITLKQTTCANDLRVLTHFLNSITNIGLKLEKITRKEIEDYLFLLQNEKLNIRNFLLSIKSFVKYLQMSENKSAPIKNIESLIFQSDIPRKATKGEHAIKYIPDEILEQLEANLEYLTPKKYIPVIITLRASGWRISDVLNLRHDKCLEETSNGYFLCGDILKTQVLEHRIPISNEIAMIIKDSVEKAKSITINKDNYLFVTENGKRKGLPYSSENIQDCLNRFAKKQNIIDKDGNIFRFKTHAFRHTKAVELINNGMNLLHVQKWMAHLTPIMTLHYAKLLDNTMRKSWEDATKDGLFKLDSTGNASKVDISNIEDEDIIEWEWIKHNLDAVRMPLGYCMKPNKMECATQLNPCLTCRSLYTTPEFIPSFKQEIQQTKEIISKGKSQNRTFWVEKNKLLLDKLTSVLTVLESGKIKHDAGKSGREYIGEQRNKI